MPWYRITDEAIVRAVQARIYRKPDGMGPRQKQLWTGRPVLRIRIPWRYDSSWGGEHGKRISAY